MLFTRLKALFCQKNLIFHQIFYFQKLFWFWKNLTNRVAERQLQFWKIQVFFRNTQSFFQKKTTFVRIWEILFQFHSTAICHNLVIENFQIQNRPDIRTFSIGKKTLRKMHGLSGWFFPYYKCGRQIIIIVCSTNFSMKKSEKNFQESSVSSSKSVSRLPNSPRNQISILALPFSWTAARLLELCFNVL